MRLVFVAALSVLVASASAAHPTQHKGGSQTSALAPSARTPAEVVDAFHAALERGDARAAQSLLTEDALIFEEGGAERGKAEYSAHHLGADAAFSKAVPGKVTRRAGGAAGNIAWIATEGRTTGAWKAKAIDRVTTETMVLRRSGGGWKIVHIHWSSAAAQ